MKKPLIAAAAAIALAIAGAAWWLTRAQPPDDILTLYGNVDIRQVALAFDNSERIADMQVEEGDRVRAGQVLARQETRTLQLEAERAQARASAQEQALLRLRNGSRPQEIAQARARADAATADAALAQQDLQRLQGTARATDGRAVSRQDIDRAAARLRVARAQAETQAKALQLALLGPRDEDIAEAAAQWQASLAELALSRTDYNPGYGIVDVGVFYANTLANGMDLKLQLNIKNLFNKTYYDRNRFANGTTIVWGNERRAMLNAQLSF
ncbi:TonB-dependent receptor [Bordetella bronchiseptica]|uniref:TonB-dependent receptor n=1 Tax=Bordetella bronchiseptica TaxID=518 RepID=UPI000460BE01|nr:TonB-dependent receptor [Bordetella bronchiseptica]KDB86512.1 membrane fusion domain protein [Bordetella bronchiseptica D989]